MRIRRHVYLSSIAIASTFLFIGILLGVMLSQPRLEPVTRNYVCNDKSLTIDTNDGVKTITYIPAEKGCE